MSIVQTSTIAAKVSFADLLPDKISVGKLPEKFSKKCRRVVRGYMPIPSPEISTEYLPRLQLHPQNHTLAPLPFRISAHFVDLMIVAGISLQGAEGLVLTLLQLHIGNISRLGEESYDVFWEVFDLASNCTFWAFFVFCSFVYFVGLNYWKGRTLGQGLFGLKLQSESGGALTLLQCVQRTFFCFLIPLSGGILFFRNRHKEKPILLQDKKSKSFLIQT